MNQQHRFGPFIWGARTDLLVFGGSWLVALALIALAPMLAEAGGALPPWGFLLFVIAIDVGHVHATLFRTYLDRVELARRPVLYAAVPLACFAVGVVLYRVSPETFWRALAYVALTHFVRQQVGWVAIYRARAGGSDRFTRVLDDAAIYAGTLYPVLVWHCQERAFAWFVPGDFVRLELAAWLPLARWVWIAILGAYALSAVVRTLRRGVFELGKHLVVISTASSWYLGIVATNSDFTFTVANVIVHGVPYFALLWAYASARTRQLGGQAIMHRIVKKGAAVFVLVLVGIAFVEELLWDHLVWHDHASLFGASSPLESPLLLGLIVPLLALPQATHYVLDAVLWRRRDTGAAQAHALGFPQPATASSPAPLARG